MTEPLVISCYFGDLDTGIWPAPNRRAECVFYSNNRSLDRRAHEFGWNFKYVDFPLSSNLLISSLQSKYVKFMQMIDERVQEDRILIYTDHKNLITDEIIEDLIHRENPGLIVRNTPSKKNIKEEIAEAKLQWRYKFAMQATEDWVQNQSFSGRYHYEHRLMNTGLLAISKFHIIKPLFDSVYRTCWKLAQPECQVIFGLLQQPYEELTFRLDYDEIPIMNDWPSKFG